MKAGGTAGFCGRKIKSMGKIYPLMGPWKRLWKDHWALGDSAMSLSHFLVSSSGVFIQGNLRLEDTCKLILGFARCHGWVPQDSPDVLCYGCQGSDEFLYNLLWGKSISWHHPMEAITTYGFITWPSNLTSRNRPTQMKQQYKICNWYYLQLQNNGNNTNDLPRLAE